MKQSNMADQIMIILPECILSYHLFGLLFPKYLSLYTLVCPLGLPDHVIFRNF